jgi:hypothetical protein
VDLAHQKACIVKAIAEAGQLNKEILKKKMEEMSNSEKKILLKIN